jgi:hypothetical protein
MRERFNVMIRSNKSLCAADIIILAVKPQTVPIVLSRLGGQALSSADIGRRFPAGIHRKTPAGAVGDPRDAAVSVEQGMTGIAPRERFCDHLERRSSYSTPLVALS